MTLKPTVISRRSFVGNGAYIPDGTVLLPENVLIGVQSRAPANECMQPGDTWLGSPPINLPAREQTAGYPEALTFRPLQAAPTWSCLGRSLPHHLAARTGHCGPATPFVLNVMPLAEAGRWQEVFAALDSCRGAVRPEHHCLRCRPQMAVHLALPKALGPNVDTLRVDLRGNHQPLCRHGCTQPDELPARHAVAAGGLSTCSGAASAAGSISIPPT